MARRARRTPLEKYQEELAEVQASIRQYEECLETLQEREKELQEQLLVEKFKEINEIFGGSKSVFGRLKRDAYRRKRQYTDCVTEIFSAGCAGCASCRFF